jgi:hypothetical protein
MKNQRRFKASNYRRGCPFAKAFGVSAAGIRSRFGRFRAGAEKNLIFFEMSAQKILRKGEPNRTNLHLT